MAEHWFLAPGETQTFTAPAGGVVHGTPYLIGGIVTIATVDAAVGVKFTGYIGPGVVIGPKATGAWTEAQKINWDDTAKKFTTGAGTLVGVAYEAAASGDATGKVRLDGVTR